MKPSEVKAILVAVGLEDGSDLDRAARRLADAAGLIVIGRVQGIVEEHGVVTPVEYLHQVMRDVDAEEIDTAVCVLLAAGILRSLPPARMGDLYVCDQDGNRVAFLVKV